MAKVHLLPLSLSLNSTILQIFRMQPFNCVIDRRIHCSPIRNSPSNNGSTASRPKYPVSSTCLPMEQPRHVIFIENQPKFPIKDSINQKIMKELDSSQSFTRLKLQEKVLIQRRDKINQCMKTKESDIGAKLNELSKELTIDTSVSSDEYLRVWFENLALKQKLKVPLI